MAATSRAAPWPSPPPCPALRASVADPALGVAAPTPARAAAAAPCCEASGDAEAVGDGDGEGGVIPGPPNPGGDTPRSAVRGAGASTGSARTPPRKTSQATPTPSPVPAAPQRSTAAMGPLAHGVGPPARSL